MIDPRMYLNYQSGVLDRMQNSGRGLGTITTPIIRQDNGNDPMMAMQLAGLLGNSTTPSAGLNPNNYNTLIGGSGKSMMSGSGSSFGSSAGSSLSSLTPMLTKLPFAYAAARLQGEMGLPWGID